MQGPLLLFAVPPGAGAARGAATPALVGAEAGAPFVVGDGTVEGKGLPLLLLLLGEGEGDGL